MPPPGSPHPQGYSKDHIPQSFMNKRPPPPGLDSNTRPYVIFFSYLGTCVLLTLFVIQKLLKNYLVLSKSTTARPPPRKYVVIFAGLAATSLLSTWYYMIRYFKVSYKVWLMWRSYYELPDELNHWGLWLRDTSLFKEAWEIAIVGHARYWWTSQIFFFACVLGLALEQHGVRRGIRHTWVFMLLGQIVAISFATNLFLLALILSPPAPPPPSTTAPKRRRWMGVWIVNFISVIATEYPAYLLADWSYWNDQGFFKILIVPHLALLVLPFARAILPRKYLREDDVEFMEGTYKYLWAATFVGGALVWWRITALAYDYSGIIGIYNAILEHPAVSSVGFDVVCCWISWFTWWRLQKRGLEAVLKSEKATDDPDWEGVGLATTVEGQDDSGAVRRR